MLSDLWRSLHSKSWLVDGPLIVLAWWAAFWLRFNLSLPQPYFDQALRTTPVALACMAAGLLLLRVPRQSWRYVSLADLRLLAAGVALGALLATAVVLGWRIDGFPRSVFLISAMSGASLAWILVMIKLLMSVTFDIFT